MLRPIIHLIKDRRIRSVLVDNGQLGERSNSSLIRTQEDGASLSQSGSDFVNVVRIDSLLSLGESRQDQPCVVSQHNSEWIEVDLSGSGSVRNEVGTCMSHLDTNRSNGGLQTGEGAMVGFRTASVSHLQDANSVTSSGIGGEDNASDHILLNTVNLQTKHVLQNPTQLQPVSSDASFLQHGTTDIYKTQDAASGSALNGIFPRTVSAFSTDSLAEYCRICQQLSDEPLIELGCHCRGDLAKTHRTCIQKWFKNKGSNKCEVCRHVATNLPPPASLPLHKFWAWRISRPYGRTPFERWQGRGQFHPLLAALLILVAGLLFDVLISYYLGASALPVNIIIGVLVVLGLGTAGRLIVECWHEQRIRRLVRRMDVTADMNHLQSDHGPINIDLSS